MEAQEFFQYLCYASITANALAFLVGLRFIKRLNDYLISIFILTSGSLCIDVANLFLTYAQRNNFYLFHFYTAFEFSLWVTFYFLFMKAHFKSFIVVFGLIPLFYTISYIDYRINGLNSMDNLSTSIEALVLTFFSLFSFWLIMNKSIFKNLLSAPFFYVNSGVLLYFLGNLTLFAFTNYISKVESENYIASWAIHSILNICFYLLTSFAFLKSKTA